MSLPEHNTEKAKKSEGDGTPAPKSADSAMGERFEVEVKDAVTGTVLGYGAGDTPEEAFERAMEEVDVSGTMPDPSDETQTPDGA